MLIRFVVENIYSFGERKEFTMIPNKRLKTLQAHKYDLDGFEVLKLSSIYGANGAGKSNLAKSLLLLQRLIVNEISPVHFQNALHKFGNQKEQTLAIEFIQDNTPLYYAVVLSDEGIVTEELYLSGLGKEKDKLLFERNTVGKKTTIQFLDEFERDAKSQMLKAILLEEFITPKTSVLKLLSNRSNKFLKDVRKAYEWFSSTLQIITPNTRASELAHIIDMNPAFKKYAEDLMCSFNIGIKSLKAQKDNIRTYFGKDDKTHVDKLIELVESTPGKMIKINIQHEEELVIFKENNEIWVKTLKIEHASNNKSAFFNLNEESDGTVRLLDFVPAFKSVISAKKVYVIDEIERSIHPLLIKELVEKFSLDDQTKGQLIFTTHESNLLDQKIFRQDEIWFAEKDANGSTDLYSLSDFKEHKTIDIRKGYLSGRYGAIPFLGNLEDLKWHEYDFEK